MKIDGKIIALKILNPLKLKIQKLGIAPHLAIILIGNDPASHAYVKQKKLKADFINAKTTIKRLSSDISNSSLLKTIQQFNNNSNIHGIIVQQPLPPHINIERITQAIDPKKDVDGFHYKSKFKMPIALAVFKILEEIYSTPSRWPNGLLEGGFQTWLSSQKIVVIGKGNTGGKSIIEMFEKMKIKPSIIDSKTKNPKALTKKADIIISAVGKPNIIKSNMIKKGLPAGRQGVVLISIGLHKGFDGKLHGDYEEDKIKNIASFYTPTPGGVGPVNVAMLLKNLVKAAENISKL